MTESDGSLYARLSAPFAEEDIEWRIQRSGESGTSKVWALAIAYVTNRAIQERLDTVVGPMCWQNQFFAGPVGGVMCGIGIVEAGQLATDPRWVWKYDGAEIGSEKNDGQPMAIKGAYSAAMKRAAVQWGIGRYLYGLDATFAEVSTQKVSGWNMAQTKNKTRFWWSPPHLPMWALPRNGRSADHVAAPPRVVDDGDNEELPASPSASFLRWRGQRLGEYTTEELSAALVHFSEKGDPAHDRLITAIGDVLNLRQAEEVPPASEPMAPLPVDGFATVPAGELEGELEGEEDDGLPF